MANKTFENGSIVFNIGDSADVAYQVISGKVDIFHIANNKERLIKSVSQGDIFGEHAVFDPAALRPYKAIANGAVELVTIQPDEFLSIVDGLSPALKSLLNMAVDKMKLAKNLATTNQNTVRTSDIKKITIKPASDKLKSIFKPIDLTVSRLPFRIGGYPEGGEANRRDTVHLSIPSAANPLRISRQHCEIDIGEDTLLVTDLGSRFCTTVNETRIGRGRGSYSMPLKKGENKLLLGSEEDNYLITVLCE